MTALPEERAREPSGLMRQDPYIAAVMKNVEAGTLAGAEGPIATLAVVDAMSGRNLPFLIGTGKDRKLAVILAALIDTAPEPMASVARNALYANSGIEAAFEGLLASMKERKPLLSQLGQVLPAALGGGGGDGGKS